MGWVERDYDDNKIKQINENIGARPEEDTGLHYKAIREGDMREMREQCVCVCVWGGGGGGGY